jgi:hypothetical protein
MQTKICSKCGIKKLITEFYKDERCKLGIKSNCKECHKKYDIEKYRKNSKKIKINRKNYYKKNKEREINYSIQYEKNRRKIDSNFKILRNLRQRIRDALKGNSKSESTINLVGCSIEFLKKHLEFNFKNGMSFKNYGKWHIDHIRPCASFDLSKASEQKECFHYTNLQPLWAEDNLSKGIKVLVNAENTKREVFYNE